MWTRNLTLLLRQISTCSYHFSRLGKNPSHSYVSRWHVLTSVGITRSLATPPPQLNISDLSAEQYHTLSEATMERLLESLESLLDDIANPEYEVEYHSGVLTLLLGAKGTYVINKQPPNKQIWLSSPFSGPIRYEYSEAKQSWLYSRDGRGLEELLNTELSAALERPVKIDLKMDEFVRT